MNEMRKLIETLEQINEVGSFSVDKQSNWLAYARKQNYDITEKYGVIGTEYEARDNGKLVGVWRPLLKGTTGWFRMRNE